MVTYTCIRCSHTTNHRTDFMKHLSRKNPCHDVNGSGVTQEDVKEMYDEQKTQGKVYECEQCNSCFTTKYKKYYHKKTIHGHGVNISSKEIVQYVAANAQNPLTINVIQNQTISNCNNTKNTTQNTTQHNVTQTVNAFGNENFQHLLENTDRMTNRFLSREGGWIKAAEELYYDKEHPENNTVRITNKKLPYAKTHDGNGSWKTEKQTKVLEDMIVTIKNLMDEHLDANETEIRNATHNTPRLFEHAKSFLDGIKSVLDEERMVSNEKVRTYKMVLESLKCMVLSNS
jgi:hypothetical protein